MDGDKISDYTETNVTPPRVTKRRPVDHPYKRGKTAGYIVFCHSRGGPAYLSKRSVEDNLFRKHDSYPISAEILQRFRGTDLDVIYIAEDPSRTVYEYTLDQYLHAPVYEWDIERGGRVVRTDRQRCPSRADAKFVWEDHASDLYHSPV